jgi:hypothetical protein
MNLATAIAYDSLPRRLAHDEPHVGQVISLSWPITLPTLSFPRIVATHQSPPRKFL